MNSNFGHYWYAKEYVHAIEQSNQKLDNVIPQDRSVQVCEIFINWQGSWYPCCGYRLRVKPRNSKFKEMMMLNPNIKLE